MKAKKIAKKTGNVSIASDEAWVVYHATTGHIHHVHRVITMPGGTKPKPAEIKTRAMELARKGGGESPLEILMVPHEKFHLAATHKVDPKKKSLLSEPTKYAGPPTPLS
jgi:hypothetical protein